MVSESLQDTHPHTYTYMVMYCAMCIDMLMNQTVSASDFQKPIQHKRGISATKKDDLWDVISPIIDYPLVMTNIAIEYDPVKSSWIFP